MALRQPIVSLMGHVDHGKTTLLDRIAGSVKAEREAGGITQHIGAIEVPLRTVVKLCQGLIRTDQFTIPGLLFIDTPGHRSFVTMRRRGGALADIAVVVIDVNEGIMPQTREVLQILRHEKTPFVVAANKVDVIQGFRPPAPRTGMAAHLSTLPESTQRMVNEKLYALSASLDALGFSAERYDRIQDYTRNVALVPVSAKTGAGIPDLLAMLVGLAQRFLESELAADGTTGEATILERAEERGVGAVANIVVYRGRLRVGDPIMVTGTEAPFMTRVRGLYRPNPGRGGSAPGSRRMEPLSEVEAAAGVQLAAPDMDRALPGGILKVVATPEEEARARDELFMESNPVAAVQENGLWLKADTLGGLEALAFECQELGHPIKGANVGAVSKHDIAVVRTVKDPLYRAILAFNVPVLPEASQALAGSEVRVFQGDIIFRVLEEYAAWREKKGQEVHEERRKAILHPARFEILPGFVFRSSKPAIVGIKVLAGDLRPPVRVMREDGTEVGTLKGLQAAGKSVKIAPEGEELAAAIEGATVGRSFREGDILLVSLGEEDVRRLRGGTLRPSEQATLDQVIRIHRAKDPFWGA